MEPEPSGRALPRVLGTRSAFVATTIVLVAAFGWTFFATPGRPAPADDPAYTVWRTETLLVDPPRTFMEIEGPGGMHSTGYRVVTPVIAGVMRRVLGSDEITPTVVLAVGCRVVLALLLAGLAYRHVRDPVVWHLVALGSGSLLLTPPFGGYTDNMVALAFLTAALYLLEPARIDVPARFVLGGLLMLAGLTHPTTLAIFCATLVTLAGLRRLSSGDRPAGASTDTQVLVIAGVAVLVVLVAWRAGIWGSPAPLREGALPPPGTGGFFSTRLGDWLSAIRPIPNALLLGCGLVGLYASRRSEWGPLWPISTAWMTPLVGILGVATGFAYPYYRFLNSTLAWVFLVGVGTYFAVRLLLSSGWKPLPTALGVGAVGLAIVTNYASGLTQPQWTDPDRGWIAPDERRDFEALASSLRGVDDDIVFVVDDDASEPVRLYGFVKRAGNIARYGVPPQLQAETSIYLGSLENLLANRPTPRDDFYERLSASTLEEVKDPGSAVVVVPEVLNRTGSNVSLSGGERSTGVVGVANGAITVGSRTIPSSTDPEPRAELGDWARAIAGAVILLIPGFLMARVLMPGSLSAFTGVAVVLGIALMVALTIGVLAIVRTPLTPVVAWSTVALVNLIAAGATVARSRLRSRPGDGRGRERPRRSPAARSL